MLPEKWFEGTLPSEDVKFLEKVFEEFPIVAHGLEELMYGDKVYKEKVLVFKAGHHELKAKFGGGVQRSILLRMFCESLTTKQELCHKMGAMIIPNRLKVAPEQIEFYFFEVVK